LKEPTGVRAALTMTISSSFILLVSTSPAAQGHNVVILAMEAYGWGPVKARGKASGAMHKERATDLAVAA
jgi:hypothetical protein